MHRALNSVLTMDAWRGVSGNAAASETARSFKLNTTLISVTEFVSFTNFTLHPKLCQKKPRVDLCFVFESGSHYSPSVLRGQPSVRNIAFHLKRAFTYYSGEWASKAI